MLSTQSSPLFTPGAAEHPSCCLWLRRVPPIPLPVRSEGPRPHCCLHVESLRILLLAEQALREGLEEALARRSLLALVLSCPGSVPFMHTGLGSPRPRLCPFCAAASSSGTCPAREEGGEAPEHRPFPSPGTLLLRGGHQSPAPAPARAAQQGGVRREQRLQPCSSSAPEGEGNLRGWGHYGGPPGGRTASNQPRSPPEQLRDSAHKEPFPEASPAMGSGSFTHPPAQPWPPAPTGASPDRQGLVPISPQTRSSRGNFLPAGTSCSRALQL